MAGGARRPAGAPARADADVLAPRVGSERVRLHGEHASAALLVLTVERLAERAGSHRGRCVSGGINGEKIMITDSIPWKRELTRLAAELASIRRRGAWTDANAFRVERALLVGFLVHPRRTSCTSSRTAPRTRASRFAATRCEGCHQTS